MLAQQTRLIQAHADSVQKQIDSVEKNTNRRVQEESRNVLEELKIDTGLDDDLVRLFNQFSQFPAYQVMLAQLQMIRLLNKILEQVSK